MKKCFDTVDARCKREDSGTYFGNSASLRFTQSEAADSPKTLVMFYISCKVFFLQILTVGYVHLL